MNKKTLIGFVALACSALAGCSAKFSEIHHFATVDDAGEVKNIFRVTVAGNAQLTNARYISGFYDERAVDLFFNELSAKPLEDEDKTSGVPPIFKTIECADPADAECKEKAEGALKVIPVGADLGEQGSFVMILSTNADAIANTIGEFAENEVVMQSVMYLAARDEYESAADIAASAGTVSGQRNATMLTIERIADVPADTDAERKAQWLAVLRAAAAGISPSSPPTFADEDEAGTWFKTIDRRSAE